jgi:hypothetical protein
MMEVFYILHIFIEKFCEVFHIRAGVLEHCWQAFLAGAETDSKVK